MQFLPTELILDLHNILIKQFGGAHGIRDRNLLESALAYPPMLYTMALEFYCR